MRTLAIAFGVDIEMVKSTFGSKNENLFFKVQQSNLFHLYDEELSFKRELQDIIFNYVPKEDRKVKPAKLFGLIKEDDGRGLKGEWNDYGHALLCLCDHLGQNISPTMNVLFYREPWWNINTLLRENGSRLNLDRFIKNRLVFDTPFDSKGIFCNCFDKEEVPELLNELVRAETSLDKANSDLMTFYTTLKEGLEFCAKNNYDLVSFSHEVDPD